MKEKELVQELPSGLSARERFIDPDGRELVDPTPVAPPVGYERRPSMVDIIRAQVREHASRYAEDNDMETFDEADDFVIGDDYDPSSPYEENFDPVGFEPGAARKFVTEQEEKRHKALKKKEAEIVERHEKSRAASERPKPEAEPEGDPEA